MQSTKSIFFNYIKFFIINKIREIARLAPLKIFYFWHFVKSLIKN